MARAARSEQLKQAFKTHKDETEVQKERLEKVFELLGKRPQGKTCPAIEGIIEEGSEVMEEYKDSPALDAALLAAAQAVEHYEIYATAPRSPGPRNRATARCRRSCKKRWPKKRRPTRS